ncbi:hypothetical protein [Confluentibacter flavum]|uniref:DUF4760 domain-containing protein n=1 Tax=Confluentibacter flavum TaxID=1909700 RepID=A0A2N3HMB2_9FLAO|nr:hypothetical protein [Confluentibacter flavum]PKQ46075.1 hypothetical protein CSW08_04860 [Confluentibacter flavum]
MSRYIRNNRTRILSVTSIFLFITILVFHLIIEIEPSLLLGLLGGVITFFLGLTKIYMEDDRFFKELYLDFNLRYDKLNSKLYKITKNKKSMKELDFKDKNVIYDYFNLCAEEYFWFKKNRIEKAVWNSWKNGMNFWYSKDIIKTMWEEEMKAGSKKSYYMSSNEYFFKH